MHLKWLKFRYILLQLKKEKKNLPASLSTQVRSLDQEDPLEKEMATHFSIIALEIPWIEGAWWTTVHGVVKE